MDNIILTDDQKTAVEELRKFIAAPGKTDFVLSGPAGSGKSFILPIFIKRWCGDFKVCITGTTNKACRVIQGFAKSNNLDIQVCTIHSLLGLVVKQVEDTVVLKQDGNNTIHDFNIVIVDECSMVNKELYDYINSSATQYNVKVIYIGDIHQLPPVNEDKSYVFKHKGFRRYGQQDLTKIVRQAEGNPIIRLASSIREAMYEDGIVDIAEHEERIGKDGVMIRKGTKFTNLFKSAFNTGMYNRNPDSFRVVSWTNRRVKLYNSMIRPIFFGYNPEDDFVVGERVVTCAPVQKVSEYKGNKVKTVIVLPTDTEGVVKNVDRVTHPGFSGSKYEVWALSFSPFSDEVKEHTVFVPTKAGSLAINKDLSDLAASAKTTSDPRKRNLIWNRFWHIKNMMNDIRPAHAYTAHKSQGSSYDVVFVDAQDIGRNQNRLEALQCLYVAVTRARRLVVINSDTF